MSGRHLRLVLVAAGAAGAAMVAVLIMVTGAGRGRHRGEQGAIPPAVRGTTPANGTANPGGSGPVGLSGSGPGGSGAPAPSGAVPGGGGTGGRPSRLSSGNAPPAPLDVPVGSPLAPLDPPDPGWQQATALDGTGAGQSGAFAVAGHDTQIRFRTSAATFHVFIVDQVQGRDATAGFADVDCAGPCADLMVLTLGKGRYHLEVESQGGPWEASLEELRPAG